MGKRSLLTILVLLLLPGGVVAQVPEHEVKAAFVSNFLQFTEFSPTQSTGPLKLCIYGGGTEVEAFDKITGATIRGRTVEVVLLERVSSSSSCHVLYFTGNDGDDQIPALKTLAGHGILTIGNDESFLKDGGIISFYLLDRKVRFAINITHAEREGLQLSSKLLSLAKVERD